jgi:hypothetical protein
MNAKRIAVTVLVLLASWTLGAQNRPQLPIADLVNSLKATPGCLGVETANSSSGKNVIFAWFENKKALLGWYNSEMHQQLIRMTGVNEPGRVPLAGIAEESGPIMAIASLTPASTPVLKGVPLPVSQIAIELYQPLPGGVFVGGRFAPDTVKVQGLRDFTSGPPPSK